MWLAPWLWREGRRASCRHSTCPGLSVATGPGAGTQADSLRSADGASPAGEACLLLWERQWGGCQASFPAMEPADVPVHMRAPDTLWGGVGRIRAREW